MEIYMSEEKSSSESKDVFGDSALTVLPKSELRSTLNVFFVYMGVLAVMAAFWGGSTLGLMFDATTIFYVSLIGDIILGVFGFFIASIGGYARVTTYMITRQCFGKAGSILANLMVSAVPLILWFAVETWFFGMVMSTIYPDAWWASIAIASLWGGVLMTLASYFGYKVISPISYITVPIWFVLAIIIFAVVMDTQGGLSVLFSKVPATTVTFGAGVTFTVGLYAAGCVTASDVGRYGEKPWGSGLAWAIQVAIFMTIILFIGGSMTLMTGGPNVAAAMAAIGMGIGALFFALLAQVTTNDVNIWSGYLSWVSIIGKGKRGIWTIIIGAIGTVAAYLWATVAGASMGMFMSFGGYLGYFIPPVGAVMIADFWIFRRYTLGIKDPTQRYKYGRGTKYSLVNWPAVLAMIIGGLLSWYTGLINFFIPVINGIIIAMVIYLVLVIPLHRAGVKYESGTWLERETGF
jgi:cytosine permease